MASEDLEQSLRAEVDGYIGGRLDGLREEIVRLQSQLNEALTRFAERLESETQSNQSITVAISEHLRGARNEGIETAASEASRARGSSDVAIIKAAWTTSANAARRPTSSTRSSTAPPRSRRASPSSSLKRQRDGLARARAGGHDW